MFFNVTLTRPVSISMSRDLETLFSVENVKFLPKPFYFLESLPRLVFGGAISCKLRFFFSRWVITLHFHCFFWVYRPPFFFWVYRPLSIYWIFPLFKCFTWTSLPSVRVIVKMTPVRINLFPVGNSWRYALNVLLHSRFINDLFLYVDERPSWRIGPFLELWEAILHALLWFGRSQIVRPSVSRFFLCHLKRHLTRQ